MFWSIKGEFNGCLISYTRCRSHNCARPQFLFGLILFGRHVEIDQIAAINIIQRCNFFLKSCCKNKAQEKKSYINHDRCRCADFRLVIEDGDATIFLLKFDETLIEHPIHVVITNLGSNNDSCAGRHKKH